MTKTDSNGRNARSTPLHKAATELRPEKTADEDDGFAIVSAMYRIETEKKMRAAKALRC